MRRNQQGFGIGMLLIIVCVVGVLVGAGWYVYSRNKKEQHINSYEECAKAGNPIQESYPPVCVTKDGRRFTGPTDNTKLGAPEMTTADDTLKWYLYQSAKGTYSLRIPDGWTLAYVKDGGLENIYGRMANSLTYKQGTAGTVAAVEGGWDGPSPFSLYVPGAYYDQIVHEGTKEGEFTTNQGKKAEKFVFEQKDAQDGIGYQQGAKAYSYYFGADGKYIQVQHVVNKGDANQIELVEKALKTLEIK